MKKGVVVEISCKRSICGQLAIQIYAQIRHSCASLKVAGKNYGVAHCIEQVFAVMEFVRQISYSLAS